MTDQTPSTAAVVRVITIIVSAALLLYAAFLVRQILILVLIAMFLAVGLDPAVRSFGRLGLGRGPAVLVVFLGAILFIGGFIASVTPPLVRQTQEVASQIPGYISDLSTRSENIRELDERYEISDRLRKSVDNLPAIVTGSVGGALGVAGRVGRTVFSILTVTILTVYFLLDLPRLIDGSKKLLPASRRSRYEELMQPVLDRVSGYIIGQLTVSLIAGVVSTIVMTIVRVPYPVALGMWVAIAALIPMIGATIGAVPAVIVGFFHSLPTGIATLIFFLIYQQFENYVVHPRVMRRAVDISPAAVILAALIGATLLGFVGALMAIPTAASIKVLAQEVWIPRQNAV